MAKLKSQWEFGELFEQATPARRVVSVSELTLTVKKLLERDVGRVWVAGEITNLRLQSSGHLYFTIKDASAQLSCVLFRGEARGFNRDLLRDGAGVTLYGELTVYEARGQYQLIVTVVELQGIGALQAAFEKLKQKLQAEGLFAPARKRPLPRFPRRIGIVTSRSGAALRDVIHAVRRRYSGLELVLACCRVQGQGAGEEVACAIRLLNEWHGTELRDVRRQIDVVLVTRGGGSLEDLWAFNEEVVARAIFDSQIPVVSAVGHEIDFTITDFVADVRAATPTAAAEILTEGYVASRPLVLQKAFRLRQIARETIAAQQEQLAYLAQRLQRQHPRRWLHEQWQRLDDLQTAWLRSARYHHRLYATVWQELSQRLVRVKPRLVIERRREAVVRAQRRLADCVRLGIRQARERLVSADARLRLLSPLHVLERGYSITLDAATGKVIRSSDNVRPAQRLKTRLQSGQIHSIVEEGTGE